jgi:hypothetical protein
MLRTGVRIRTWIQNHDEAFLHGCMWMQAKADSGTKNWMLSIFQLTYSGWFQLTWWFLIPKSGCYSQEKNGIPVITRQCPGLWGHSQQGLHCEKPCSVQNVRKCTEQISKKEEEEDFTTLYKLFMALLKRQYIFASARLQHFLFSSSLDLTAQMSCHLARSCPCFGDGAKKCFLLYQIHDMLGSKETMNDRYTPLRGYQKPTVSVVIKKNRCHPFYTLLVGWYFFMGFQNGS